MMYAALVLAGTGTIILTSIAPSLVVNQVVWYVAGLIVFLMLRRVHPDVLLKFWRIEYVLSVALLVFVLLGPEVRGSHRWIFIGGYQFQPSEIVKPFILVSVAAYLSSLKSCTFKAFLGATLLCAVPFTLIFEQPDLGNSIVYFFSFALMFAGSRFPKRYILIPAAIALIALPYGWHLLEDYQKSRITTFLNPEFDIQGAGYNARQSLIAVGSGGLWGKGLGQGTQSKLQFLPEYHTDFIFASTVEQLGFVGGAVLLTVYFILLNRITAIAVKGDEFSRLVATGIFAQLFVQIGVNIGMNLGLVPITGITLPLVSFGGSSIIATAMSLAIVDIFRKDEHKSIAIR